MRNTGQKTILLALMALLALLAAGCGGGGDETETTTPTVEEPAALTKDEVIEQGDEICAEVNAAVGALSSSESEGSIGEDSEKIASLYVGMVERLQDLGEPEDAESEWDQFLRATDDLARAEADLELAAEREEVAAMEEKGQEAAAALEEFQSQAEIFGFEDCSDGPGLVTPAGGETAPGGEEFEGGEEEGGVEVEPEFEEAAPEEEIVPEEEVAPETGGAGGSPEAPAPEPETGGESGGVGPG